MRDRVDGEYVPFLQYNLLLLPLDVRRDFRGHRGNLRMSGSKVSSVFLRFLKGVGPKDEGSSGRSPKVTSMVGTGWVPF